ncbi:cytochrome P450 [Streptacidiphilus carbonis]|jgi:cytochrome P450|uniref:cytochrome P450 n=1 Tax=Streptacidiphilus carbonis TaxID=105422 RepID=UPI0005AADA74|nr:cytochrome P450 [Streptacidiphilus carbonis]
MSTLLADRWGIHPDHFWLRGQKPERIIQFEEELGMWSVFGYPEVVAILGDPVTYSSDLARRFVPDADESLFDGNLAQTDPPQHRKLRTLASHAFTPKVVADLAPRIQEITDELLDAVADPGRIEMVADLAYPLAVIVIAELLGVPSSDRVLFKKWAKEMFESANKFSLADNEELERDLKGRTEQALHMNDYLREHVLDRRRKPREDLLSKLVEAEVDGERLTDIQVINFSSLLLFAGHVTTTMLLGNTVLCLDAHPEQEARLRADRSRMTGVIEESLRFLSPFATSYRVTNAEVEIAGRTVGANQMVKVLLSAANRDERQFADPHTFDSTRDPNPHIGFGRGIHFCLGAPLARLEGQIALNTMLDRYPGLAVDPEQPPSFMPTPDFVGVRTLGLRTGL